MSTSTLNWPRAMAGAGAVAKAVRVKAPAMRAGTMDLKDIGNAFKKRRPPETRRPRVWLFFQEVEVFGAGAAVGHRAEIGRVIAFFHVAAAVAHPFLGFGRGGHDGLLSPVRAVV